MVNSPVKSLSSRVRQEGIGYACAHFLASRGASVALLDLADTTARARQLEELFGVRTLPVWVDVAKTAALEYARRGIRVNAVAPGNIDTPMLSHLGLSPDELAHATQPSGKMGKPEDVAELICFLLSERAEFMTGSIVAIDGGTTIAGYSNGDASGAFMG